MTPELGGRRVGESLDSSLAIQDSGLGIMSPPNQVTYSELTPRPYFLRGQPKYSSTPLLVPAAGQGKEFVGTNLEDRLGFLEENKDTSQVHHDSGFSSLHSSLESSAPPSPPPRPDLGTLPKRRSPRHRDKKPEAAARPGGSTDRLTRLRPGGDRAGSDTAGFVNFSHSKLLYPPSQKRALFKYDPRVHSDGQETLDVVRILFDMNLGHVLDMVFLYCAGPDLCSLSQVSQLWRLALAASGLHSQRRRDFVASRKRDQENEGTKLLLRSGPLSPRRAMASLTTWSNRSPGQNAKRERGASAVPAASPSKIRHQLFLAEGRLLNPGDRLTQCPVCTSPSRVPGPPTSPALSPNHGRAAARCSSAKCGFLFCPDCLCEEHSDRGCRVTRTGSKVPKSGSVTSKKSKARLRRL